MNCDVCDNGVSGDTAYFLTTAQVVLNINYWRAFRNRTDGIMGVLGQQGGVPGTVLSGLVPNVAAQSHAWAVCEDCAVFYEFDRDEAREYARRGKDLPTCGSVDATAVHRVVARANAEPPGTPPQTMPRTPATPPPAAATPAVPITSPERRRPWYRRILGG